MKLKHNIVFYNLKTDTAFRIISTWMGNVNIKKVKTNTGRAKMYQPIETNKNEELNKLWDEGHLLRIYTPSKMMQEVNNFRALNITWKHKINHSPKI